MIFGHNDFLKKKSNISFQLFLTDIFIFFLTYDTLWWVHHGWWYNYKQDRFENLNHKIIIVIYYDIVEHCSWTRLHLIIFQYSLHRECFNKYTQCNSHVMSTKVIAFVYRSQLGSVTGIVATHYDCFISTFTHVSAINFLDHKVCNIICYLTWAGQ